LIIFQHRIVVREHLELGPYPSAPAFCARHGRPWA
jgi:hypothetical protein